MERQQVRARKEVIISGGTIGSAKVGVENALKRKQ